MISLTHLPSADLLQQFQGVERSLRTNRRVNHAAWVGVVIAAVGAALLFAQGLSIESGGQTLALVLVVVLLLASLFLVARTKFWVKESNSPLRYTCSVENFTALGHVAEQDFEELAVWMGYDLSQRLNERLRRLAFLEKMPDPSQGDENDGSSHIHISGQYLIRSKSPNHWELQITPRVRVGGPRAPDTLGHPVRFAVPRAVAAPVASDDPGAAPERHLEPPITEEDYGKLIERVYFSAATQIYKQLRTDVTAKIALLPRGVLRATAYLYEADDYAQSNTLDAYDEAAKLYRTAIDLYDPSLRPVNEALPRRRRRSWARARAKRWRDAGAEVFVRRPRLAKRMVYAARAETGLATVLLYRRMLAGMSGHRVNSIYEARPVARRAIDRLLRLPAGTEGRDEALFRARVAEALASYQLESMAEAERALDHARRVSPTDYERDAAYLYAAGMIEPHGRSALPLLRQAVAAEPRFEVAQFELALRDEMGWRRTPTLEPAVAEIVLAEYEQVLKLNPGNVRAWGNMGYIKWLLGSPDAQRYYERGREYKDLNPGIQVANLDFGLARIEAERGDFDQAYKWYRSAVTAQVAMGVSDSRYTSAQYYAFDFVGDSILGRFENYRRQVEEEWEAKQCASGSQPGNRVFDAVLSYAYNDVGEACHTYGIRNNSRELLHRAERYYQQAVQRNPMAVLPNYNLYLLYINQSRTDKALEPLERVRDLEPAWPDAIVASLAAHAERANDDAVRANGAQAPPDTIRTHAGKVAGDSDMLRLVRTLLPHQWLWNDDPASPDPFNWEALGNRQFRETLRWERELNDLHVRVLFNWGAAKLLADSAGDKAGNGDRRGAGDGEARKLLEHVRSCYWPGNFRVLLTARHVDPTDKAAEEGLRDQLRRWLAADPTAHWALSVMTTPYYDVNGNRIPLLDEKETAKYLQRARAQAPDGSDSARWIDEQLSQVAATPASAAGT